jgi:hypothetical protein
LTIKIGYSFMTWVEAKERRRLEMPESRILTGLAEPSNRGRMSFTRNNMEILAN